jgi:membrane protein DedA with SNARE-associated domain
MRVVGWGQVIIGTAIAALWLLLLVTGQVPEIDEGRIGIWFHIAAELILAMVLIGAGLALLRKRARARLLTALALGALGYSAVNSPGWYAERGEWAMVGLFALVVCATVAAFGWVWRTQLTVQS